MEVANAADRLERSAGVIRGLCEPSALDPRWRPRPGKWSLLEVTCHLADEERDDFRTRLDLTLHRPDEPWPPIDPEGWVTSRHYADREPAEALVDFLAERERSLAWLRGLVDPDLTIAREHPRAGTLRAGDLLLSWVNHDLLHIRQIVGLHHAWNEAEGSPYSSAYAGGW